jgi:hypothetical protein
MNFSVGDKQLSAGELFRLVWRGWFVGATVTFIPIFFVIDLVARPGFSLSQYLVLIVVFPILNAINGAIFGGQILLGLFLVPPQKAKKSHEPTL